MGRLKSEDPKFSCLMASAKRCQPTRTSILANDCFSSRNAKDTVEAIRLAFLKVK